MAILITILLVPAAEAATLSAFLELVGVSLPQTLPGMFFAILIPVNALWMMPIFSIALALVYFRSRQAEGEDVALGAVVSARL